MPSRADEPLDKAKKMLYLLKTAVTQEPLDKILARIDDIRRLLNEASENLAGDS